MITDMDMNLLLRAGGDTVYRKCPCVPVSLIPLLLRVSRPSQNPPSTSAAELNCRMPQYQIRHSNQVSDTENYHEGACLGWGGPTPIKGTRYKLSGSGLEDVDAPT